MKIQIKSIYGAVLFELEKENNTQRDTILEAIKQKVDLRHADLRSADISDTFVLSGSRWWVTMKNEIIKIGCKEKSIENWDLWFSGTEEFSTERGTKEFAKIQAHYESIKAYVLFMKNFIESETRK